MKLRWSEIYTATRNSFTALGMIACGAWLANSYSLFATLLAVVLVVMLWAVFYRLAIAVAARGHKAESKRIEKVQARLETPRKRFVYFSESGDPVYGTE